MVQLLVPELLLFIVDVPALNVRFVAVVNPTGLVDPLNVTVLAPRLIERTLELLEDKDPAVTL